MIKWGKQEDRLNLLWRPFLSKKAIPKEVEVEMVRKVVRLTVIYGSEVCILY